MDRVLAQALVTNSEAIERLRPTYPRLALAAQAYVISCVKSPTETDQEKANLLYATTEEIDQLMDDRWQ